MSNLIKKIDQTGSTDRKRGNDCRRSARASDNTKYGEEKILSQETNPGSHPIPANISKRLDTSENSAWRIVKNDLKLKPFKQIKGQVKRIVKARTFLNQVTVNKLKRTLFSDEKIFKVQDHRNSQNCPVYALCDQKKSEISDSRNYSCKTGFLQSVTGLIEVSKLVKHSFFNFF